MTSPAHKEPQEAVLLPPGLLVLDVAERARSAALDFVHKSAGWTKNDLATWLVGPYTSAVGADRPQSSQKKSNVKVDDERVQDLLGRARLLTRLFLKQAMTEPTSRMAEQLLELGLVCRAVDRAGGSGYIPIDRSNATLGSRVLALFAADFLTRPRDYKDYLRTCRECDELYFDWDRDEDGPPCHSSFPSGVQAKGGVKRLGDEPHD
jgi:hypothetical protein